MQLDKDLRLEVIELLGYEAGLTITEIRLSTLQTVQHGQTGFGGGLEGGALLKGGRQENRETSQENK